MAETDTSSTKGISRRCRNYYIGLAALLLGAVTFWYWYDARDRRELEEIPGGHAHLWSMACSPSALLLMTGSSDSELRVWDLATKQLLHRKQLDGGWIEDICFREDGQQFAVARQTKTISVFDAETLDETQVLHNSLGVVSIAFLNDANAIAAGLLSGEIVIHRLGADFASAPITGQWDVPDTLAASPHHNLLAIGADNGVVAIVDAADSALIAEGSVGGENIDTLTFSPDGSTLAVGDAAGNVSIWDSRLAKKQPSWKAQDGRVNSLFYINDKVIVSADSGSRLRFWDSQDASLLTEVSLRSTGKVLHAVYCQQLHCVVVGFWHGDLGIVDISRLPNVARAANVGR